MTAPGDDPADGDGDGDDTVPTGRAGVDPLIAYPLESTGQTGQIERPGDQTPWWFVPAMFAVALGFIGLLVYVDRVRDDQAASAIASAGAVADGPSPSGDGAVPPSGPDTPRTAPTSPTTESIVQSSVDPRLDLLPPPGTIQIGATQYPVVARCEVHLPDAPVDANVQVSSYLFADDEGGRGLIERTFDGSSDSAMRLLAGTSTSTTEVSAIGDAGAFAATFVAGDVIVNPSADVAQQCDDRLVTNEPGQFSEPHTRIVLDVCVADDRSGMTIAGLTSEGARFEIQQAGGELAEIVFVDGSGELLRTSAPATILRTGDMLSASGVVSSDTGTEYDLTIDIGTTVTVAGARPCTDVDRL